MFVHARACFRTPVLSAGMATYHTVGMHYNNKFTFTFDINTMGVGTQYYFPENPEVVIGESNTEFFIRHWTKDGKVTYKKMPVLYEHVLPKLIFIRGPMEPKDIAGLVHIKFNQPQQYLTVSSGNIVTSSTPQNWTMIPHPGNSRIMALYMPEKGYLTVQPGTKQLTLSQDNYTYFMKTMTSNGNLMLQTLVAMEMKQMPEQQEMDEILDADLEFYQIFRKAGIVTQQIDGMFEMIHVCFIVVFYNSILSLNPEST